MYGGVFCFLNWPNSDDHIPYSVNHQFRDDNGMGQSQIKVSCPHLCYLMEQGKSIQGGSGTNHVWSWFEMFCLILMRLL